MLPPYETDGNPPLVEYLIDTPLGSVRVWQEALTARGFRDTRADAQRLALDLLADDDR